MMPTRPRRALIASQGQWLALIARAICRLRAAPFVALPFRALPDIEWERPVNRYSLVKVQNHNLEGGQACAINSLLVLSHDLRCARRRPASYRFKACPADAIRLEPLPVDTLRKAAGDVSALDLPARELLFCRPAHGGHLLFAFHVSGQIARKGCYLKKSIRKTLGSASL